MCEGCAQGKNTKNPFPNSDNKEKGILYIVHLDVCRPMQTNSLSVYVTMIPSLMTTPTELGSIS